MRLEYEEAAISGGGASPESLKVIHNYGELRGLDFNRLLFKGRSVSSDKAASKDLAPEMKSIYCCRARRRRCDTALGLCRGSCGPRKGTSLKPPSSLQWASASSWLVLRPKEMLHSAERCSRCHQFCNSLPWGEAKACWSGCDAYMRHFPEPTTVGMLLIVDCSVTQH